jgi:hypothetical protein
MRSLPLRPEWMLPASRVLARLLPDCFLPEAAGTLAGCNEAAAN